MRYVLSGVETNNKGAELMLYAILQEIEKRDQDAVVYLANIPQGLSYIKTPLHLKQKTVWKVRRFITNMHLWRLVKLFHVEKILKDVYSVGKIDYFFDASGFNVSDKWNISDDEVIEWEKLLTNSKRDGAKIIFLPQGFGPIEQENTKNLMILYDKYGDLIIAREQVSYDYIKSSGLVQMEKVKIYPDFTSMVKGVVPEQYIDLKGAVCVIPNVRMIDKGGADSKSSYMNFMVKVIKTVLEKGERVFLLNHEGLSDEKLAYEISGRFDNKIKVVSRLNGLEVKGLISIAKLVITSRFHGVASSLNSCVPCLCTSWSHKYSELYKDYHLESGVLPIDDDKKSIEIIESYLEPIRNQKVRDQLSQEVPFLKDSTRRMWDFIWTI